MKKYIDEITNLLIEFDEMGFSPTTLCSNPDEYAKEWRLRLNKAVNQAQIDVLCKLKQYSYCDNFFMDGKWHRYVMVNDIDQLIEELKNEN